jgi:hypothetical protein
LLKYWRKKRKVDESSLAFFGLIVIVKRQFS